MALCLDNDARNRATTTAAEARERRRVNSYAHMTGHKQMQSKWCARHTLKPQRAGVPPNTQTQRAEARSGIELENRRSICLSELRVASGARGVVSASSDIVEV
jgi:hypothetical protein